MEQICQSFRDVPEQDDYLLCGEGGIILSKICPAKEKPYEIEIPYLKRNLTEYLEGRNTFKHFSVLYNTEPKQNNDGGKAQRKLVFGIDIYDVLMAYLKGSKDNFQPDYRAFHNLYEHKKLMVKRIEYLKEKQLIPQNINKEIYMKILDLSQVLSCLIIKYHCKNDQRIMEKILSYINDSNFALE